MSKGYWSSTFIGVGEWLHDAARWIKNPTEQRAVWCDYRNTWEQGAFLRQDAVDCDSDRTVLIVSVDSPFYEVKQLAMLAVGLRQVGWRPVVLLSNRRNRWHRRLFEAHGLRELIYWDEFPVAPVDARRTVSMLNSGLSFQEVKQWSTDNCWIGPQILSSISRSTFSGAPDVNHPDIRQQLEARLPETLARIPVAQKVLDKVRPQLMLIIEANYARYAPLTDLAVHAGVDVIQVIQPNRDDAFIMRRLNRVTRRQHPSTLAKDTFIKLRERPWLESEQAELDEVFEARYGGKWFLQARNQPAARGYARNELVSQLGLNASRKTVAVFSHVLWDANLFFGEDLFQDYGEWFVETVKAAVANPEVNWIIKMHPANLWKRQRAGVTSEYSEMLLIREAIGELPSHVKIMFPDSDVSTRSLFDLADFAITVRGTVSAEAPCFGVTTLTAGTGRCDQFGFTVDSNSAEAYLAKLADIQNLPAMTDQQIQWAKRHAHTVFCRKPWVFKSWRASFDRSGRKHMLDSNLELAAHSWDEIEDNGDLRLWAEWASDPSLVDYLSPEI
jgi:hypothetical protein